MSNTLFDDEPAAMPKVTALAPWFGSNRMLASEVGKELHGCKWVGVPFAGGMTELLYIKANTIIVSDIHRNIINLANVVKHRTLGPKLYRELRREGFHWDTHKIAQEWCRTHEPGDEPDYDAALNYFIAVWMGRSAIAGINDEFCGRLPVRWNANGGDSCKRYRSAVDSLRAFRRIFERCNFLVLDVFEFLAAVQDLLGHAIYLDPPFFGPGARYKHNGGATEEERRAFQVRLRDALLRFVNCRIVLRFYDHPLIRELYPEGERWTWRRLKGRDQANNGAKPEVLIVNRSAA